MKKTLAVLLFAVTLICNAQQGPTTIADKQFLLGTVGVGTNEVVNYYIQALSTTYERINNTQIIVEGGIASSSLSTTGNSDFTPPIDWPGFNWTWLNEGEYFWSMGLYKVWNSKKPEKFFYIDSRDRDYILEQYNPDFRVYYNANFERYEIVESGQIITQGAVISPAEILGQTRNTAGIPNFWNNTLSIGTTGSIKVIWGKYPNNNYNIQSYKIYRAVTNNVYPPPTPVYSLIATLGAGSYEYTDYDYALNGPLNIHYKVTAVLSDPETGGSIESTSTNVEVVSGGLVKQHSEAITSSSSFNLLNNYPNPFNPATTINYTIEKDDHVNLVVYDVLGRQVLELVNEQQKAGDHSIKFSAVNLSSGIYYCRLQTTNSVKTNKMILSK
jgi:hypothetical protein